jgi:hypothetical protein
MAYAHTAIPCFFIKIAINNVFWLVQVDLGTEEKHVFVKSEDLLAVVE